VREQREAHPQHDINPHGEGLCGTLSRRQYVAGFAAFCLLFAGTLVSSLHRLHGDSGDFNQLIQDGELARQTGRLDDASSLEYPPTARPLFIALSSPPPTAALIVWWLLNAWMYWQSAVWLSRWIEPPTGWQHSPLTSEPRASARAAPFRQKLSHCTDRPRPGAPEKPAALPGRHPRPAVVVGWKAVVPAFALVGLGLVGVVSDLSVGQLTGLVLFCVAAAFEWDRVGRPIAAGAVWSVSLLIKPLPVVLLFYFIARRRWKLLGSAGITFLILGPVLLGILFGWERQIEGWRWFLSTTAHDRSPWVVFDHWASMPGYCLTYRESGLASSLIRLFMNVTYDNERNSVQIATLGPGVVRLLWSVLVAAPLCITVRAAVKATSPGAAFHAFAAMVGVAMLANPKFISYWLAIPMICAAPLAARAFAARGAGKFDGLCLGAMVVWLMSMGSLAIPAFRAAGSIPLGIGVLTAANLVCAARSSPKAQTQLPTGRRSQENQ